MTERKTIIRNLLIVVIIMLVAVFCIVVEQDTANCCAINSMSAVEIEDVQAGDKVMARNDRTGEVEEKEVTKTFEEQAGEIVKLTVDDEVIETTTGHPVYAEHRGYVAASQLRAGDILVDVNGEKKVVEKVQHEILEKPITVYNLEVADDHNYYVGKTSGLVHNFCGATMYNGKQIAALTAYGAINGETVATVASLISIGVLTWVDIYITYSQTDSEERYKARDRAWEESLPKPKGPEEERLYQFAYIVKNKPMYKFGNRYTLFEMTALIVLPFKLSLGVDYLFSSVMGFVCDETFLKDVTQSNMKEFFSDYVFGAFGVYVNNDPNGNNAKALKDIICDIFDVGYEHETNGHFDDFNESVQYKHYKVNIEGYNLHIFYGDPLLPR